MTAALADNFKPGRYLLGEALLPFFFFILLQLNFYIAISGVCGWECAALLAPRDKNQA